MTTHDAWFEDCKPLFNFSATWVPPFWLSSNIDSHVDLPLECDMCRSVTVHDHQCCSFTVWNRLSWLPLFSLYNSIHLPAPSLCLLVLAIMLVNYFPFRILLFNILIYFIIHIIIQLSKWPFLALL